MNKKNILLTGGNGLLGYALQNVLIDKYILHIVDRPDYDILRPEEIEEKFFKNRIDIIIHVAAYTNVEKAEDEKDLCLNVNVIGAKNMALLAAKYDIPIVYLSTDYVFDGKKDGYYFEWDKPNPLSFYGMTKYFGEIEIINHTKKFYIIRTSWLYGENGINFIKTIVNLADSGKDLRIINDQIGAPTYSFDLAEAIKLIIESDYYGIYHCSASGKTNWYEYALFFLSKFEKFKNIKVYPVSSEEYKTKAIRPKNSLLKNTLLELKFNYFMPEWQISVEKYLRKEFKI